jgi:hypothetical protein
VQLLTQEYCCVYRRSYDRDGEEGFEDAEDALQRLVEREEAEQEVEEVRQWTRQQSCSASSP